MSAKRVFLDKGPKHAADDRFEKTFEKLTDAYEKVAK